MPAANPIPSRIPSAVWQLWLGFEQLEPTALLGGIYASKPGYHNARRFLPGSDYSVGNVSADRQGSGEYAAGLDLTMSRAAMMRYTRRLDAASRARDRRLYPPGQPPILREFIGTKDSRNVYCYMLTGGRPQGLASDAGPVKGRDSSHLWHIHLSIIRRYADDWSALHGVLSVLRGEKYADYEEPGEMRLTDVIRLITDKGVKYSQPTTTVSGVLSSLHYYVLQSRNMTNAGFAKVLASTQAVRLSPEQVDLIADAVAKRLQPPAK